MNDHLFYMATKKGKLFVTRHSGGGRFKSREGLNVMVIIYIVGKNDNHLGEYDNGDKL